jgi:2,3-bisphosphoglycerate-dependent phosphoglycerate mutase
LATRLLIVRHGRTAWNSDGRFQGQLDIPLDEVGQSQAAAVAHRLASERPLAIYASDLSRAWQTARWIQNAITEASQPDPTPPLVLEPRLREMHFGEWQGLTYAEIQACQPEALAAWEANWLTNAPPGGETLAQLVERVQAVYREILAAHPDGTVLIVGHGGALQALLCLALGLPPERFWQLQLDNTGVADLRVYPEGAILNLFNDTCHLEMAK